MKIEMILTIFVILFLIFVFGTAVWGYRDAMKHRKHPVFSLFIGLMLISFPILGLIIYLSLRKYYKNNDIE